MALTRKYLRELGLSEAQIDGVIEGHSETVEALKAQIPAADAPEEDTVPEDVDWEAKYREAVEALEAYRAAVQERERVERVRAAFRKLLEGQRIDPRRFDAIMRATAVEDLKLDGDGRLEDAEALAAQIRREWADFVLTEARRGTSVPTPPAGGQRLTREEILAIADAGERQRAIAENHMLFGF